MTTSKLLLTFLLTCFAVQGIIGKHDRWEVRARGKGLHHIMNYHTDHYPKKQYEEHHEPKIMYYPMPYQMPMYHQPHQNYEKPQQDETKLTIIPLFTGGSGYGYGNGNSAFGNGNQNGFGPIYI